MRLTHGWHQERKKHLKGVSKDGRPPQAMPLPAIDRVVTNGPSSDIGRLDVAMNDAFGMSRVLGRPFIDADCYQLARHAIKVNPPRNGQVNET